MSKDGRTVITPRFRVSFANVFRPGKPMKEGEAPKYGVTMLFEKDADLSLLRQAAHQAAVEDWGADQKEWPKNLRSPFRDQGEKDFAGYVAGNKFVNATSQQRPGLVDEQVRPIIEESKFYSGCYAIAEVRAFTYDKRGNRGVAFGLQNIQKVADGEPLGGRSTPESCFTPIGGTAAPVTAAGIFD